jgi:hypothetical protein
MSLIEDGREIVCDGPGCTRRARPPIGLRKQVQSQAPEDSYYCDEDAGLAGWLFVTEGNQTSHYCPKCARAQLAHIMSDKTEHSAA